MILARQLVTSPYNALSRCYQLARVWFSHSNECEVLQLGDLSQVIRPAGFSQSCISIGPDSRRPGDTVVRRIPAGGEATLPTFIGLHGNSEKHPTAIKWNHPRL